MTETNRWIPVKVRPLTDEEKKLYEEYEFMYDCKLPDDEQQVLITTKHGNVEVTTFCNDIGCYFEQYEDADDIVAWMPLPSLIRRVSKNENSL